MVCAGTLGSVGVLGNEEDGNGKLGRPGKAPPADGVVGIGNEGKPPPTDGVGKDGVVGKGNEGKPGKPPACWRRRPAVACSTVTTSTTRAMIMT